MNRGIVIIIFIVLLGLALQLAVAENAVDKLGRGIANVVTSPLELSRNMGETAKNEGIIAGMTTGMFKGLVDFVKRAGVGVFEVATFPVPVPEGYGPIIRDPEYFLEGKDEDHDL